jgi:hypothetical protein
LQSLIGNGQVAEWLGFGLQHQLHRFESGPDLFKKLKTVINTALSFFIFTKGELKGELSKNNLLFTILYSPINYFFINIMWGSPEQLLGWRD